MKTIFYLVPVAEYKDSAHWGLRQGPNNCSKKEPLSYTVLVLLWHLIAQFLICEKETTSHLESSVVHDSILSQQLLITEGSILENNLFYGNSWSLIVKMPRPYLNMSCRKLLESLQCANSDNRMQAQVR